jgi:hypothetical protein
MTLLNGSFLQDICQDHTFSPRMQLWIESLKQLVKDEISLEISMYDFKKYFHAKQEHTASSPSGHHIGHYRAILECICHEEYSIPQTIISIAHLSLITLCPLNRWQKASQVMVDKGKGKHVDNLRIIQLCEADLNFLLHTIWGHRLIRHACQNFALDSSQSIT